MGGGSSLLSPHCHQAAPPSRKIPQVEGSHEPVMGCREQGDPAVWGGHSYCRISSCDKERCSPEHCLGTLLKGRGPREIRVRAGMQGPLMRGDRSVSVCPSWGQEGRGCQ